MLLIYVICYMKAFPWQCSRDMCIVLVIYHFLTHIGEVVFIKMPSRQQQRRAKRRAEYLQNRNEELETSLGFGASRVCCDEQNSDELRASKRQKQQETNRDSKRIQYWINPSAACLVSVRPKGELCMEYYGLARFF